MTGIKSKVKIVKNKVAPPFKFTELEVEFGKGISYEGDLLDLGVTLDVIEKSGTWYSFESERLGQGREAAKATLISKPELCQKIEGLIRAKVEVSKAEPQEVLT